MLLVAGAASYVAISVDPLEIPKDLSTFSSESELYSFLDSRYGGLPQAEGGDFLFGRFEGTTSLPGDYSRTNVQVEGVDESDIVKTDGRLIYIAGEEGVYILRAYPPEQMTVMALIPMEQLMGEDTTRARVEGLFLLEDRLIVLSSTYGEVVALVHEEKAGSPWIPGEGTTLVAIFDVENPGTPSLLDLYQVSGALKASRMTGGHVYVLTQSPIYRTEQGYALPRLCRNSLCEAFDLERILYNPEQEHASSYTNVLAIDPVEGGYGYISIIAGSASTVYMSRDNLYVTFTRYEGGWGPMFLSRFSDGAVTSIYRIGADQTDLWVAASGAVPGRLLNQFSMDESDGYLRVVTTVGWRESTSGVYVLDEELRVVGSVEDLAPGERVYAARFLGSALYLVTFKKVDPFFVIDLSDPARPRVLGYLKIPGFSEYLHPLGDGYVLGVGKETVEAEEGDFAWFQGLKLSLFDVRDAGRPLEVAKYTIGARGTSSEVLADHKAFLYMPSRDMIVLPVTLAEHREDSLFEERPSGEPPPFVHGEEVWQGAYVISISPEEGISPLTRISHFDVLGGGDYDPYQHRPYHVRRSLYIGDYLYTISESIVRVDSLVHLSLVAYVLYSPNAEAMK
jgi:uncharacterized secreted protein with C-terminal beta-propeller domain